MTMTEMTWKKHEMGEVEAYVTPDGTLKGSSSARQTRGTKFVCFPPLNPHRAMPVLDGYNRVTGLYLQQGPDGTFVAYADQEGGASVASGATRVEVFMKGIRYLSRDFETPQPYEEGAR